MKNTLKVLGIIAIAAVIGFSMTACGEEPDTADSSTNGRLTVTGLSHYIGGKIGITSWGDGNFTPTRSNNSNEQVYDLDISDSSITVYVWNTSSGLFKNYTGNDQNVIFSVNIDMSDETYSGKVTVNFSNGIGSGAFVPD